MDLWRSKLEKLLDEKEVNILPSQRRFIIECEKRRGGEEKDVLIKEMEETFGLSERDLQEVRRCL